MLSAFWNWLIGNEIINNEPVIKKIGTVVECNASSCMDNFEGQCILESISLTKDKLNNKSLFNCSEYSEQDNDLVKEFNKEAGIISVRKVAQ